MSAMRGAAPILMGAALGAVTGGIGFTAGQATWSGLSLTGAMVGGLGGLAQAQIQQGQEQAAASNYNAQIDQQNAAYTRQTAEYNAQLAAMESENARRVGEYNAQVYEMNARAAEDAAGYNAAIAGRESSRERARQRAQFAAAGVATGTGSPLLVDAEAEYIGQLNQNNILYGGAIEAAKQRNQADITRYSAGVEGSRYASQAYGIQRTGNIQATGLESQAQLDRMKAGQYRAAGVIGAGSSLLTGASLLR